MHSDETVRLIGASHRSKVFSVIFANFEIVESFETQIRATEYVFIILSFANDERIILIEIGKLKNLT